MKVFRTQAAFHLADLLIALSILAVLLALAISSFRLYQLRVYRADAVTTLIEVAACQEQIRTFTGSYDTTQCLDGHHSEYYQYTSLPEAAVSTSTFLIRAEPRYTESTDRCGWLQLNHEADKQVGAASADPAKCWNGR